MAELLVVLEAYAVIEQVHTIFTAARERFENASRNPTVARNLANLFHRLLTELAPLAKQCKTNDVNFSEHHLNVFNLRIRELKTTMDNTRTNLDKKIKKLKNPLYRWTRVSTTSEWLSELEATARRADQLVFDITACFANATLINKAVADIKDALNVSAGGPDSFHSSFVVPRNPPHVILDFGSASDMEEGTGRELTLEAQLKRAVLRSDGSQSVSAVGSSVVHTVGTKGMSGVGKSCALRGLATDAQVRQRFSGGIYFIVLGQDAKKADVVQQLAQITTQSGGTELGAEIAKANIDVAVLKTKEWLYGKCSLLLIDDAWERNEIGCDVVAQLGRIVDVEKGSCVAFTTRDLGMVNRTEAIHFSARNASISRQILLAAARPHEDQVEQFEDQVEQFETVVVDEVLRLCGGLPMALSVSGNAILMLHCIADGSTLEEVWKEYLSVLRKHPQRLVQDTVDGDAYKNLASSFRASLDMLENSMISKLSFKCGKSFFEMYRALIVQSRQGWVPVRVLCRLWGMRDEMEAREVLNLLARASLGERKDRMLNGRKMPGISLHDLQLDFVQSACEEYGELEKWHRELLCSWIAEEGSSSTQSMIPCRRWSKDDIFGDEYIRDNVSRHLMCAGLARELYGLLKNPEWTAKRLRVDELLSLEEDFRIMLEHLGKEGRSDLQPGGDIWSLKMIAGAARLSSSYVSQNSSEVWFQLYARLGSAAEKSEVIRLYRAEIEQCADKPWLKALTRCLPEAGGALETTMMCDGGVKWISELDGGGGIVACGRDRDGAVFVRTFVKGQVERTVWLSHKSLSGVEAVCCTEDGSRVVTGHEDGTVQVWDAESGQAVGEPLRGHSSEVRCVAWSGDGRRVASGSWDRTVRLWDVEKGEAVGEPLRGHSDVVECVAWSGDGRRVASGSLDRTVRLWDVEKGGALGEPLRGHTERVVCVAWSGDGRHVASGSSDRTVRL